MKFEVLSQADYVLNACGRLVAPPGFRFVDLPYFIPYLAEIAGAFATLTVFIPDVGPTYTFTALAGGASGNLISFQLVDNQGIPNQVASVSVIGTAILASGGTDGAGFSTSTFDDLLTLMLATPAVTALVSITLNPIGIGLFVLSFGPAFLSGGSNGVPSQGRFLNNTNTEFIAKGLVLQNTCEVKIKWPNGHFLTQSPVISENNEPGGAPNGRGSSLVTFSKYMPIDRGARIGVSVSGDSGSVNLQMWGVLRYLIRAADSDASRASEGVGGSCIVGYATPAQTAGRLQLMDDPIAALESRDRIICGPNQNIMAPEWFLGNQCCLDTPPGYEDESFTFFSEPVVLDAKDGSAFGRAIVTPGAEELVIRRFRVITQVVSGTGGFSTAQIRLPNGYSFTGGDMINFSNFGNWFPMFPRAVIKGQGGGGRIIIDIANSNPSADGQISTVIEFDAAKRRKIPA